MKKITKEKMILVSKALMYLLGFVEINTFIIPIIFIIMADFDERQFELGINAYKYCCIMCGIIFAIIYLWSCYYSYLYERKEEKEVKIKVKPYKVKGVYSSFDEIYKRIYNELIKKKYKETFINITSGVSAYIFEHTFLDSRRYYVLINTKKFSKTYLYLISDALEEYDKNLRSVTQTHTTSLFVVPNENPSLINYVNTPIGQGFKDYNCQGVYILNDKKLYIPKNINDINRFQYNSLRKELIKRLSSDEDNEKY